MDPEVATDATSRPLPSLKEIDESTRLLILTEAVQQKKRGLAWLTRTARALKPRLGTILEKQISDAAGIVIRPFHKIF